MVKETCKKVEQEIQVDESGVKIEHIAQGTED